MDEPGARARASGYQGLLAVRTSCSCFSIPSVVRRPDTDVPSRDIGNQNFVAASTHLLSHHVRDGGPPGCGRTFAVSGGFGLGDCSPGGRLRLDATARYLQDLSDDDTRDAGLGQMTWVVRRTVIDVHQFPTYLEPLDMVTWCSGIGSRWAERRVDITAPAEVRSARRRCGCTSTQRRCDPRCLRAEFDESSPQSTGGRTVSSRLTLDAAAARSRTRPVAGPLHRLRRDGPRQQRRLRSCSSRKCWPAAATCERRCESRSSTDRAIDRGVALASRRGRSSTERQATDGWSTEQASGRSASAPTTAGWSTTKPAAPSPSEAAPPPRPRTPAPVALVRPARTGPLTARLGRLVRPGPPAPEPSPSPPLVNRP